MLSLVRVLLVNALSLNDLRSRRRRGRTLLVWGAVLLGVSPIVIAWAALVGVAYAGLGASATPLYDLALAGAYALAQFAVLFTAVPMAWGQLLRARDLGILLSLPLRPGQIVVAKLATLWVFEFCIGAALLGPVLFHHLVWTGGGPARAAMALALLATMPVLPLCGATLAVLLLGNVPRLGRSGWFWQLISLAALLSVWLVMARTLPEGESARDLADLAALKVAQARQLGRAAPGVGLVVRALTADGLAALGGLLSALAAAAAGVGAVLLLADRLYLRPVLEGAGAAARGHGRAEAVRPRPFLLSCARREIAGVLREPAVALNGLGGYLAVPLALAVSLFMSPRGGEADGGGAEIAQVVALLRAPEAAGVAPLAFAGAGLAAAALGALSSLFSTSFSKDGRRLWIERSLPVAPYAVFLGKWLGAMAIVAVAHGATMVVAAWFVRPPLGPWLYACVVGLLAIGACGAVGLSIDALRPKLVWKETVEAVKQNANVPLGLLASAALLGTNALLLWACAAAGLPAAARWLAPVALNLAMLGYALVLGRAAAARFGEMDI